MATDIVTYDISNHTLYFFDENGVFIRSEQQENIVKISSHGSGPNRVTFVIDKDGNLYCSGYNGYGGLGLGNTTNNFGNLSQVTIFKDIDGNTIEPTPKIIDVVCDGLSTGVIDLDGNVYASGAITLWTGITSENNSFPSYFTLVNTFTNLDGTSISPTPKISKISFNTDTHGAYLDYDGNLYVCGSSFYGQLGLGHTNSISTCTKVPDIDNVSDISVGPKNTVIVRNGSVYCAGEVLGFGGLGGVNMSTNNNKTFIEAPTFRMITHIGESSYGGGDTYYDYTSVLMEKPYIRSVKYINGSFLLTTNTNNVFVFKHYYTTFEGIDVQFYGEHTVIPYIEDSIEKFRYIESSILLSNDVKNYNIIGKYVLLTKNDGTQFLYGQGASGFNISNIEEKLSITDNTITNANTPDVYTYIGTNGELAYINHGATFTNYDFTNVSFKNKTVLNANLTGANLTGTDLTNSNFTGANLTGATLPNTMTNVNLTGAIITDTTKRGTTAFNKESLKQLLLESSSTEFVIADKTLVERTGGSVETYKVYNQSANITTSDIQDNEGVYLILNDGGTVTIDGKDVTRSGEAYTYDGVDLELLIDDGGNEYFNINSKKWYKGSLVTENEHADTPASGEVTISGDVQEGGTVSADTSNITDVDGLLTFANYIWEESVDDANWTAINGATSASYDIPSDQSMVDKYIRVHVTATDALGGTTPFVSEGSQIANVDDVAVGTLTMGGDIEQGGTVIATIDISEEDKIREILYFAHTFETQYSAVANEIYRMQEYFNDVENVQKEITFTIPNEQSYVGKWIRVGIAITDPYGGLTTKATPRVQIANVDDEASGSVTISGLVKEGETVSADTSAIIDQDGNITSMSYNWEESTNDADWSTVGSEESYTISNNSGNNYLRVTVTTTDELGGNSVLVSASVQIEVNNTTSEEGDVEGVSFGDPHIVTLSNEMYELPNKMTNYRMIQGENLVVNVKTRAFTEREKEAIKDYYVNMTGDNVNVHKLVTDGVVQSEVFIKNQDELIHYNFDSQTLSSNMKVEKSLGKNEIKLSLENECHGRINVYLKHYENPQVYSGLSVSVENKEGVHGLLENVYETSDYELKSVYSKKELRQGRRTRTKPQSVLRNV